MLNNMLPFKKYLKESKLLNWFGDSKIIDEEGNPKVVYHGTDEEFEIFDRNKSKKWAGKFGFWFTDSKEFASSFGDIQLATYLKIKNPYKMSMKTFDSWREKHHNDLDFWEKKRKEIEDNGYDGIVITGEPEKLGRFTIDANIIYVAFYPNQIKSINNKGEFSDSENILEKYLTSMKHRGDIFDIYVNPSDKEVKEIGTNDLRFIFDLPNKELYVFNAGILHDEAITILHREGILTQFDYTSYWKTGKDSDKYLTMSKEGGEYFSDSLSDMISRVKGEEKEKTIENVKKVLNSDFSWVRGKWFNHEAFQRGLDEIRNWLG